MQEKREVSVGDCCIKPIKKCIVATKPGNYSPDYFSCEYSSRDPVWCSYFGCILKEEFCGFEAGTYFDVITMSLQFRSEENCVIFLKDQSKPEDFRYFKINFDFVEEEIKDKKHIINYFDFNGSYPDKFETAIEHSRNG